MLKFTCTNKEISCIIGNLFTELEAPCKECLETNKESMIIKGRTHKGTVETLELIGETFLYSGAAEDIINIRERRCLIK